MTSYFLPKFRPRIVAWRKQKSPRFASRQLLSFLTFEYLLVPSENQTASSLTRMQRPLSHLAAGNCYAACFQNVAHKMCTIGVVRVQVLARRAVVAFFAPLLRVRKRPRRLVRQLPLLVAQGRKWTKQITARTASTFRLGKQYMTCLPSGPRI